MATYLLTWNPNAWAWQTLDHDAQSCRCNGYLAARWGCGRNARIQPGDRVFLLHQGRKPRGLIGSGWATSPTFEGVHWRADERVSSAATCYIQLRFGTLMNAEREPIFRREWLDNAPFDRVNWNTRASGIRIPDDVAEQLEDAWSAFIASSRYSPQAP